MCGIYLAIGHGVPAPKPNAVLVDRLRRRGPDAHEIRESQKRYIDYPYIEPRFEGTVLSLRGDHVVPQPIQGEDKPSCHGPDGVDFQMAWNGEAWSIDGSPVAGADTEVVYQQMFTALQMARQSSIASDSGYYVLNVLAQIRGPYAFVFLDTWNDKVYFARDCLGRRSLLFKSNAQSFVLSSVGDGEPGWVEAESDRLYVLDMSPSNSRLSGSDVWRDLTHEDALVDGVSSSGLAFAISALRLPWSYELFKINDSLPPSDLLEADREWQSPAVVEQLLRRSLEPRLAAPQLTHRSVETQTTSRVAVLFSGGLDCSVLARLAHDILPSDEPVDLLNVAFHNPRVHGESSGNEEGQAYETCPDRITARSSLAELRAACPTRTWRFVEINVPYAETQQHRSTVMSLLHPHDTEMDLSIGLALYFAARGEGLHEGQPYHTPARVLLSGLGADELFGGYQRHATAHRRGGFPALISELALDTSRLGKRNLGRDDRVIAHWGREARYPYLDESFVVWAAKAPVWDKCGFGQQAIYARLGASPDVIEPGKMVLRLLAGKLGMPGVACEKKRAIQFGARTAKMEKGRTKGTDAITS